MSKKSVNLIYKLDGNIESIDLFEMTAILVSLGNTIQESNKIINPVGKEMGINIKPIEKGSIIIDIALFAQNNFQEILSFANSTDGQQIKQLLEFIGLIGAGVGGSVIGVKSLIDFIKWLNGKPYKNVEKITEQEVKITNQNNNSINIPIQIFNLYKSPIIKSNIYNMIGKPLEKNGISNITGYIQNEEEKTKNIISKDIITALKEYEISDEIIEENDKEIEEELYISPKRGSFSGEKNSWSFRRSANNDIITVNIISDEDFLEKCKKGDIRPFEKDMLKVNLKTILNPETMKAKKVEIVKVLEYIPYKNNQQNLFDSDK